ncbi:unnamed protein product [Polarella glacialis]|uniref:Uncharacterized protein n=2 Tax=Polarella glacialis TaxID=89957 RepID=A0A813DZZ7_POLGL|nr:unnamed protein product [Polarella glacialis]
MTSSASSRRAMSSSDLGSPLVALSPLAPVSPAFFAGMAGCDQKSSAGAASGGSSCSSLAEAGAVGGEVEPREPDLFAAFFVLGAASDVTFNALVLCVPYLRQTLGKRVLLEMGICQFAGSTGAMLLLLAFASEAVARPRLKRHLVMQLLALGTMMLLNVFVLSCALLGRKLPAFPLLVLLLLGGISSGTMQSLVAVLAGLMTKFTRHDYAAAAQMSGHGFGILLPSALQLMLLAPSSGLVSPALAAGCSAALGVCVLCLAVGVLRWLQWQASYRTCAAGGVAALSGSQEIEDLFANRFAGWLQARFWQLLVVSAALALNFAFTVYCGQLTPFLPLASASGSSFGAQLPTLLLSITNVCDFAGRWVAARLLRVNSSRPSVVAVLLIGRSAMVVVVTLYAKGLLPASANEGPGVVWVLAFGYAVNSTLSGLVSVGLTQFGQEKCMRTGGANMDTATGLPCPIAAQVMWLASVVGSISGTLITMLVY